jgi:hypothetical protein
MLRNFASTRVLHECSEGRMKQSFSAANMKLLEKISGGVMKKVALATELMGGFLSLRGSGNGVGSSARGGRSWNWGASSGRGYVGPGPVYVAPRPHSGPVYVGPRYGYPYNYGSPLRYGMRGFTAGATGKRNEPIQENFRK